MANPPKILARKVGRLWSDVREEVWFGLGIFLVESFSGIKARSFAVFWDLGRWLLKIAFAAQERNSESFLFCGTAGNPPEPSNCSVYSVFRGKTFLSEIANPKMIVSWEKV